MHESAAPLPSPWRRAAGNAGWLVAERLARTAAGFFVGAWVARHLTPEGFGAMNAALSWVGLFACVAGLGLEPVVVRELVRRPPGAAPAILSTVLALRGAANGLLGLAALFAAWLLPALAPAPALVAIASAILLVTFGDTLDLWFQARLLARRAALARTAVFALSCAARIALIVCDAAPAAFLWVLALEAAVSSAGLFALARREGARIPLRPDLALAREFLAESWPAALANLAAASYLRSDRVMLAALQNDAAAGLYSAAAVPVDTLYFLPMSIAASAAPILAETYARSPGEFMSELARLARLTAAAGWLLALGLAATSPWLMPWVYGASYAGASSTLALLALGMPFAFLGVAVSPWYQNTRLTHLALRRHLLGGLLNVGLNFLFIPRWGPAGAALATLAALACAHVFSNALAARTRPLLRLQLRALALLPHP